MELKRRNFLAAGAAIAAVVPFADALAAGADGHLPSEQWQVARMDGTPFEKSTLSAGAPVLQAPGDTTMGITWEIRPDADGTPQTVIAAVEYATRMDFSDAKTVTMSRDGKRLVTSSSRYRARVCMVRLTGLEANTAYYYRTITQAVDGDSAVGAPEKSPVYRFTTFGPRPAPGSDVSFAVVNDPHAHFDTWKRIVPKIAELKPSVVIYNGDLSSWTSSADQMVRDIFAPIRNGEGAGIPIMYSPGNHDSRGGWSRNRHQVLMPRSGAERGTRFEALLHNYAVRLGDLAMIGLDTGEDKADYIWGGESDFDGQNRLQTEWLKEVLERPDIKSAKQIVVFTHIPLWAPGSDDVQPGMEPHYYTYCQFLCKRYWEPLLNKANVRLVVSAHTHYREHGAKYLAQGARTWHQLIGGGPCIGGSEDATVIYGKMQPDGRLKVEVYSIGQRKNVDGGYAYDSRSGETVAFDYEPRPASVRT